MKNKTTFTAQISDLHISSIALRLNTLMTLPDNNYSSCELSIEKMRLSDREDELSMQLINYSFNTIHCREIMIASTTKGICQLSFVDKRDEVIKLLKQKYENAEVTEGEVFFHQEAMRLLNGECPNVIQLHLCGTDFQIKVWDALLKIPRGKMTTYGAIASYIHNPGAVRAVASAIALNPVALIIPCHRVVPVNGTIGKYHWGSELKALVVKSEMND